MLGPDNAYNKKNANKTRGGSKDIKDKIKTIINKLICGTL